MNTFEEQSHDDALRKKLNAHEFNLPPLAWENMQSRLDDMQSVDTDAELRQKILAHEFAPPAFAWDKMQTLLNQAQPPDADELLRQKVAQQQFVLPAFAWETMQTALEQTDFDQQLQKVTANYQFDLPVSAWDNMQAKIEAAEEQKRRRKIAIAWCWRAAFLGLLLSTTAAFWYANNCKKQINLNTTTADNQNQANIQQINVFELIHSSLIKSATLFKNNSTQQPIFTPSAQNNTTTQTLASTITPKSKISNNNIIIEVENKNTTILPARIVETTHNNIANNNSEQSDNNNSITKHEHIISENITQNYLDLPTITLADNKENALDTDPIALSKSPKSAWKGSIWVGVNAKLLQNVENVSITPVIGIGASYQLSARQRLMAGIQFKQILTQGGAFVSNIAPIVLNENPTERADNFAAAFDNIPMPDVYQMQKVNLIEIPLSYHYQISRRHAVQLGTKLGIIADVATKRKQIQEMPTLNLSRHDVGIELLNMAATLAYEYKINKNWSLNLQYTGSFSNMMYNAQQKYRPYVSFWDAEANKGSVFLLLADNKPSPPILLEAPEKMFNNDLMLSLRFNF